MNDRMSYALAALAVICAAIPIVFFFANMTNQGFLESSMGNWFATTVGIIIGIPIALAINRHAVAIQEERNQVEQRRIAAERQRRVLTLLRQELAFNLSYLQDVKELKGEGSSTARGVHVGGLRDVFWSTFSAGEDVRWLVDTDVIESVSLAYYYLRNTVFLERQYFAAVHFPTAANQEDRILGYLQMHDAGAVQAVKRALAKVDELMGALTSGN